jgi:hypothetical protein
MAIREKLKRAGAAAGDRGARTGRAGARLGARGSKAAGRFTLKVSKLVALAVAGVTAVFTLLLVLDQALLGDSRARRER